VADSNRDVAPGRADRGDPARRFLRVAPPEPVPLLSVPQAFAAVTTGAALVVTLVELLRRVIVGWT